MESNTTEERLQKIEQRNIKVESDKKWETSWVRKISIVVLTYIVTVFFLFIINETQIFLKALVPVMGFVLSTISLGFLRSITRN
jgi:sorbitol-specific phosphotransferase system component IIBC